VLERARDKRGEAIGVGAEEDCISGERRKSRVRVLPERRESHTAPHEVAVALEHVGVARESQQAFRQQRSSERTVPTEGVAQIASRLGIPFEHQTMRVRRDRHESLRPICVAEGAIAPPLISPYGRGSSWQREPLRAAGRHESVVARARRFSDSLGVARFRGLAAS
jgi:hypothetical protein